MRRIVKASIASRRENAIINAVKPWILDRLVELQLFRREER
jgi:hypothetical protein